MRGENFIRNFQLWKGLTGFTPCNGRRGRGEEVCVNRTGHTGRWGDDAGTSGTGESRIVLYVPAELLFGIFPGNSTRKTKKGVEDDMKLDLGRFWLWCLAVLKQCHDGCVVLVQAILNLGFSAYSEADFSVKVHSKLGGRLASIPGRGIVGFFSGGGLKQQTAWTPIICLLSLTTPTSLGVGLPTAAWHADDHFQGSNDPQTPPPCTHTPTEWLTTTKQIGSGGSCGEHWVRSNDN